MNFVFWFEIVFGVVACRDGATYVLVICWFTTY